MAENKGQSALSLLCGNGLTLEEVDSDPLFLESEPDPVTGSNLT